MMIFNRPWTTKVVFERIRQARPRILMLIADGPRQGRANDAALCRESRRVAEEVDWPCEVLKNYSEANLGCGARVATGLDWVFEQVEEAIILEDDCVPDLAFFRFSHELLDRYRHQDKIMQVSGSNFLFGRRSESASYYFSRYPLCWGWATWRRAWQHFDLQLREWKVNRERCLATFTSPRERAFWETTWDRICSGRLDTWDYQWSLAHFECDALAVVPAQNLITNIGFGLDATHTRSRLLAVRPALGSIRFPLVHPAKLERDMQADGYTMRRFFYQRSTAGKAVEGVRRRVLAAASRIRAASLRPGQDFSCS